MSKAIIYLILPRQAWEQLKGRKEYRAPSLESEGFIHASASLEQVLWVANRVYLQEPRLVVLCVDRDEVKSLIKDEMARDASAPDSTTHAGPAAFPHVYGPVNLDALLETRELARSEGRWVGWRG